MQFVKLNIMTLLALRQVTYPKKVGCSEKWL